MATTFTPPIDLYAESTEGFGEDHHDDPPRRSPSDRRPPVNGDRDEPAIETSRAGLERVLGW
ncbi:MAG TPA: hypothetical protein VGW75_03685 [Solirubrobacteraceae bacterium]|jgi:hypothetical protein|nr:hypothetical protein [Solirubrobacteraceae bacterium]